MRRRRTATSASFDLVDVDVDDIALPAWSSDRLDGIRVVARREGVPVGAGLLNGRPPRSAAVIRTSLLVRPSNPPERTTAEPLHVTIAVCTRDRPALLERCLASISESAAAARDEVDADLLVVDNASPNDLTRKAAVAGGARWVSEPVPGLDVGRNRAIDACRGEVLAFVDDDVVVDRMWLRTLARTFAADPTIDAVSGGVLAYRLETTAQVDFERSGGFSPGWSPMRFEAGLLDDLPFRSGMGAGCNMAFRRALFDRIGRFDEALDTGRPMPGGGDLDMLVRTVMAGVLVYEPSAVVYHEHRREWKQLRYQYYSWGKGWAALLDKWYRQSPARRRAIRSAALHSLRGYARDLVKGPRRTGRYRRWHCVLLAVGFVAGAAGAYGRSRRRMERRRRDVRLAPATMPS